jgi:DNA mismatch repair ATPase MutS
MADQIADSSDIERVITRYNTLGSVLVVITTVIAIICIYFGIIASHLILWGLLVVIPLIWTITYLSDKRKRLKYILQIRSDWGKSQTIKERDFKTIRPLFDYSFAHDKNKDFIDEQTWKDLNMDQLYGKIDRTYTDPGEAVLYRMLREPLYDKDELTERSRVISFLQNNHEAREKIQFALIRLGHQFIHNDVFSLLWRDNFPKTRIKLFYNFMALAAVISLIIPFVFWSAILIPIPIVVYIINLVIHYRSKRRTEFDTFSFPYLIRCIKTAGELSSITNGETKTITQKLAELYKASSKIIKNTRFLFPKETSFTDTGVLFEYLSIFFLLEVRAFYDTTDELNRHILELRELYVTLGELDTLQSIASYRASLTKYSEPSFDGVGCYLEVKEAKQPLLDNPVPVSISIHKNIILITGSNMGGKSTFLRTIGNNVLMAQTIATTTASSFRGAFFRIVTSISRTDDLVAGKSFYYVEAERILKTIQSFDKGTPTLCIIDELLSGTNSVERLHASEAIIQYLAKQNTLAIIATHDLELAQRLNGVCDFYHFASNVDENGLKFDYLLKPGIATTRNAIALLKYLGYPKEITDKAQQEE